MSFVPTKKLRPIGPLPPGEFVLWQGQPQWRALALRAFHVRKVAIYFVLLAIWRLGSDIAAGGSIGSLIAVSWLLLPCGASCGVLAVLAWLSSRTTQYTITSRRIVMQIGVALPITLNIPFRLIGAGALRCYPDGTGDIPLAIAGKDRLAYLMLWPHARPWRAAQAEPMLRAVADARLVSTILARAVAEAAGAGAVRIAVTHDAVPADTAAAAAAA